MTMCTLDGTTSWITTSGTDWFTTSGPETTPLDINQTSEQTALLQSTEGLQTESTNDSHSC